ncbi:MAG: SBBP repeat-containing protein [Bacteroidota bacterium]
MKKNYFIIIVILLSVSTFSQEVDLSWANSFGDTSGDQTHHMTTDLSGNIFTTGFFKNTVDFDPSSSTYELTSNGDVDIFVQKLDSDGNFIWAIAIGGTSSDEGYGISTDTSGNIFVTGGFNLTVDFDHGSGTHNLTSNGSDDIFILKLDTNGSFIWVKSIGGTANDQGRALITDTSGSIYLTGYYQGEVDFNPGAGVYFLNHDNGDDAFILKLDANGDFVWANAITSSLYAQGYAIQIDGLGNVLVTGTLDAGNVTFIKKIDNVGNTLWYKTIAGSSANRGHSIITDALNNVYVTGIYQQTTDFDPSTGIFNLTSIGGYDIFILKLNSDGDFLWVKSMGESSGDSGEEIIIDNSGYIYITGTFEGTVDFDPSSNIFNLTSNGGRDIFIQKLDENGSFVWASSMGGIGSEYPRGFLIDPSGSLYLTGIFQNTIDFDPSGNIYNLTSNGSFDIFNIKLGQTTLGVEESTLINDAIIFPNPFQNVVNINLRNHNEVSVKMFNVNGQLIFNEKNINTEKYQFSFDGIKGIYFIEVNYQGEKQHFKLIKQ